MRLLGLVLGTLALVATLVSPAAAAPAATSAPVAASGKFSVLSIEPIGAPQPVGGICRINLRATFGFTGTLTGQFTAPFEFLSLAPCGSTTPAQQIFQARGTYVGSVANVSGAFDFVFVGTIDTGGNASGDLVVLHGSGGLSGLVGSLHLAGQAGVGGDYSGVLVLT